MANEYTLPAKLDWTKVSSYLNPVRGTKYGSQAESSLRDEYGAYGDVFKSLLPEEQAQEQLYGQQSGMMKNRLVGSLNSRGLGNSLLGTKFGDNVISGQGSGALQNLAMQRLQGRNALRQGYTQRANELNNQLTGGAGALNDYYQRLGMDDRKLSAQEEANSPNFFSMVSPLVSLASLL